MCSSTTRFNCCNGPSSSCYRTSKLFGVLGVLASCTVLHLLLVSRRMVHSPHWSFRSSAAHHLMRVRTQCEQDILDASDPMVGNHSLACPMVVPSVFDICRLNSKAKLINPPPANASEFCSHTKRQFASLKSKKIVKHAPNPGQCAVGDATINFFCDTRLDVYFFHRNYTAQGFRKSTPDVKEVLFPTPMKRIDGAELWSMPKSKDGGQVLCVLWTLACDHFVLLP